VGRPFPVAASSAVELALVGPPRPATVIATTTHATYLEVADADRTMLCLTSGAAVRVPCAVVLGSRMLPPQVPVGTAAVVGDGQVAISDDERAYRVQRWWRPPVPRGLGAVPPARLAATVRWLTGRVADPLDAEGRGAVADLVAALAAGVRPDAPVTRLLGRGPGLTPTGDDVLAGALVTLHALGSPAAATLARAVLDRAPGTTTPVSEGLLRHAAYGRCIPQLADLLESVGGGSRIDPGSGDGGTAESYGAAPLAAPERAAGALPRAAGALLAVGHCSGAGLLHGVLVAVAIAHARLAHGVVRLGVASAVPAVLPAPSPVAA
jgi:hypothetical protein